jgi:hypothetical protein
MVSVTVTFALVIRAFTSAGLLLALIVILDGRNKSYSSRSNTQTSCHFVTESSTLFFIIVTPLLTLTSLTAGFLRFEPASASIVTFVLGRQVLIRSLLRLLTTFTAVFVFVSKVSSNTKATGCDSVVLEIRRVVGGTLRLISTFGFWLVTKLSHFSFILSAAIVVIVV